MAFLRLFGGASIEGDDGPVAGPPAQRHRLALLALLSVSHPSAVARDKAIAYLWPDRDTERARNLLSQAVHAVRRAFGERAIQTAGDDLRVGADVLSADVIAFREAAAAGDYERAVALYVGPFLDGFYLPNAAEFEHWVQTQRDGLRRAYVSSLETMAGAAADRGRVEEAVEWWCRLAAEDPISSRHTIRLMEALEAVGARGAAMEQARIHALLLESEFDAAPDPEVVALAERMRREPNPRVESETGRAEEPAGGAGAPRGDEPGFHTGADSSGGSTHRPVFRAPSAALLGAAALVALAGLWAREVRRPAIDAQRVAVAPFENRTRDVALDPVGNMAADWIALVLSQSGIVGVVPTSVTHAAARERSAGVGTTSIRDLVRAIAEETGAGLVISGAYYLLGDSLRFQAQITDSRRNRLVQAIEPVGALADAPERAIERLGDRLLGAMGPILDERLADDHLLAYPGRPPSYDAYRAYAQGRDAARRGAWREAGAHYQRALAIDSTYLAPRLSLAWAMGNLGESARLDTLVAALDRSRSRLTPYEAASLDQLMAARGDDRLAIYEAARRVANLHPGSPAHVQWGIEALGLNRPREAIRILSGIDPTRGERGSTAYWRGLTGAYHAVGDHRRELREARRARRQHPDEPAYLLLEGIALAALGRVREVDRVVDARLALPDQRLPRAVGFMLRIAFELRLHGHPEAAQATLERGIDWYHRRPSSAIFDPAHAHLPGGRREAIGYRFDYATALHYAGRHDEAEAVFRELAAQDPENVSIQGALGLLAVERGDRVEAERIGRWLADRNDAQLRGNHTFFRACIAAEADRREEAVLLLRQAYAQGATFWPRPHFMPCLARLRGYEPFDALMKPKG
jgi:DNA-binding SARP family transcriptional activator/Flp pilus assembly protein TadD